jgi:hypothetical protein
MNSCHLHCSIYLFSWSNSINSTGYVLIFTECLFFVPVGYSTWLSGSIICSNWLKFQRSSSLKLMNWLNPNCKWLIIGMVPIGPMVSEKKLEMWKVYRRRTPSDGTSSHGPLVQVN